MAEDFEVMPDYLAALEVDLRAAAVVAAPPMQPRKLVLWRRPLGTAVIAAIVVLSVLLLSASVGRETRAYGAPTILSTPGGAVPEELSHGLALELATGSHGPLDKAWPIKALQGGGYVLRGRGIFCLWARDSEAATNDEPAVICGSTDQFFRFGLWLTVGHRYVAALPDGVPNPTLTHSDGATETLHPDDQGVVNATGVTPGDTITLHGTNGQELTTDVR